MKRLLYLSFIIAVMVICSNTAMAWDLPLAIDVVKIHFNYDPDNEDYDGLTIQENQTEITAPEWYSAASKNEEAAFLKSLRMPTVKAEFYAYDLWQGYSNVTVITDSTDVWRLSESTVTFLPNGTSGEVSFNTNASYQQPDTVGKWSFSWAWMVTKIDGGSITPSKIDKSNHVIYNVLAKPNAPMDTTWVEVLDYSCVWTQGEDTVVGAATKVAEGIYDMDDLDGDLDWPNDGDPRYTDMNDYEGFDLSRFFENVDGSQYVFVNCSDCANLFNIFSAAIGCDAHTMRRWGAPAPTMSPMDEIGDEQIAWVEVHQWAMHQYGWLGSKVYDPVLKLNQGSPFVPCDMNQVTYELYLISSGSYTGYEVLTAEIID